GAITDARGIAAAFALGAAGVQIGTAYLWCPEATISAPHRAALNSARDDGTALTNLMTGRPARGIVNRVMREIGPMSDVAPEFPARCGCAGAVARQGRGAGLGRFLAEVGRAGGRARPRPPRRPVDQDARRRGARADADTRRIEGALAAHDAQARTPRICRC